MMTIIRHLIALSLLLALSACGQSGGLYLPQNPSPTPTTNDEASQHGSTNHPLF